MNRKEREILGLKSTDCFTSRKIETIVSGISDIQSKCEVKLETIKKEESEVEGLEE